MSNRSKQVKEVVDLAKSLQTSMLQVDATVARLAKAFDLVVDSTAKASKQVKEQKDYYQKGYEQLLGIKNLNKDLKKELEDQAKSAKVKTLAIKTGVDVQIVELQLAKQEAIARAQSLGASEKMLQAIRERYEESIKYTRELVKEQELGKKEEELAERIKKYDHEKHELLEKIKVKQELITDIITDQRAAQALFVGSLIETGAEMKELMSEFRAEGLTVTQAMHEVQVASGATMQNFFTSGASLKDNAEIMGAMTKEMGALDQITSHTVGEVGKLSKTLGISNQLAGQLQGQFQSMAGSTAESATQTMEYAGALAKAAHVAPGAVMAEIAGNAEATALYAKDGGKNIATAAVAAKKLGVEFGTITKMADGLLDFESRINNQMEASVLLGREINLDKAAELALNNDLVGATQEMLQNVGGEAEFNKMNVVQRKALAQSMGISVQELSKMVKNQDKLKDLTEEQREALADGSMTMDEVLANSKGVGERLGGWAVSLGSGFMSMGGIAKGMKDSLETTKGLIEGWKSGAGLLGKMKGALSGGLGGTAEKSVSAAGGAADKAAEASKKVPKDAGKSTGGLTKAIEKINPTKLLAGAAALMMVATAVFIFAKAAQEFTNVSWGDLGKAIVGMIALVGALALVGAIMMSGVGAVAILAGAAAMLVIAAALWVLGKAIQEIAKGFDMFVPALLQLAPMAFQIVAIGAGLLLMGAGMLSLGVSSLIAAPGLVLASLALMLMLPSLVAMNQIAQQGFFTAMGEGLMLMAAAGPGLGLVALSLMGVGAGLGLIALAGVSALPIIGALIGLAAVAPALIGIGTALGEAFGGGGGESDKMDELIAEVRSLKTEMANITVNLDGKKVGDALRGSMNTSRIR